MKNIAESRVVLDTLLFRCYNFIENLSLDSSVGRAED
jgi:hypothetical protein